MNRHYSVVFGIAFAFGVLSAPALAGEWIKFTDDTYGCRVDFPSDVFQKDVVTPGRPLKFSGPNDETYFQIMGSTNSEGLAPQGIRKRYFGGDAVPGEVTYESAKGGFLVLSGYRGDNIFYTRLQLSPDRTRLCIMEIIYPREDKVAFDQIVTRMSRSFESR